MSVKQVSVYDGSSWVTEDIGANASNITLGSTIGGTTNLQEALTRFLPASTITKSKIVITNSDGKLAASDFAVSALNNLVNVPSNVQAQIDAEKTARQEADSALSTNLINQINAEKTARETADNNLAENKANQSDLQNLSKKIENKANQSDLQNLSARMDNLTNNVVDIETVLWEGELSGLNHNPITLSDNVTNYDYIDFYFDSQGGKEIKTIASNSTESTFRFINLSNALRDSNNNIVTALTTEEINIILSGTTARFNFQVQWYWQGKKDYDARIYTFINDSTTYSDPVSGQRTLITLKKIVGRKLVENTEVNDIRIGYDSTQYNSAGQAVREQVKDLRNLIGTITAEGGNADMALILQLQEDLNEQKAAITNSEKVLWTGTKRAVGTIFNLIDDITNYDYLDFYVDFYGQNETRTIETSSFLSMSGGFLREVQIDAQGNLAICSLNFGLNESYTNQLKLGEHTIWSWNGAAAGSSATYSVTTDTGGTYPNGFAVIRKIVGRKDLSKLFS